MREKKEENSRWGRKTKGAKIESEVWETINREEKEDR